MFNAIGDHRLDLANPSEYAIALQLCDLELASLSAGHGGAMQDVRIDGSKLPTSSSSKGLDLNKLDWPQSLPRRGMLELTFVSVPTGRPVQALNPKP